LFARYTFDHPERAAAELRAVLRPEIVAQVDWSSLHRESGSVVDAELRERQSDLLFSARLRGGQPLLLYLLLEHQSSVDRWMAFRMLQYVMRHLERWRQQHPDSEKLPVVLPVVLYHGPEGGWTAARRMEELFELPEEALEIWRETVPRFEYQVDDLTAVREEALRARAGPPLVRLALVLLRSGRSEKLAVLLEGWRPLLAELLASPGGREDLRTAVYYLLEVGGEAARKPLQRVLNSIASGPQAEDVMKTMKEAFIEEGHAKGLAEGVAKGLAEGQAKGLAEGQAKGLAEGQARSLLRILASRHIDVDERTRQRILACTDLVTLDRWLDRALNATSLSELDGL
jgi:flagellar biosynthesis/type III secretory pathway protein FliH